MTSEDQENSVKPRRAKSLEKEWKKMHDDFYANNKPGQKGFKEKESFLLRLRRAISWLDGAQHVENGIGGKDKNISALFIFFLD